MKLYKLNKFYSITEFQRLKYIEYLKHMIQNDKGHPCGDEITIQKCMGLKCSECLYTGKGKDGLCGSPIVVHKLRNHLKTLESIETEVKA